MTAISLSMIFTGKEKNRIRIGDRFHSSPVYHEGNIFVGNDDGNMYAFKAVNKKDSSIVFDKAVFYIKDPVYSFHKYGLDAYLKDYFVAEGYQLLDEDKLAEFLRIHIQDKQPSVLLLATNYFPEKVIEGKPGNNLIFQYLKTGGKIVATGLNPSVFKIDYKKREFQGYDYSLSNDIIGFVYPYKDLRSHKGFYSSTPTYEGRKWGLFSTTIGNSSVNKDVVTPLSIDENDNAAYWVKNYGFAEGTGLVQFWITPDRLDLVKDLKRIAEYGLR